MASQSIPGICFDRRNAECLSRPYKGTTSAATKSGAPLCRMPADRGLVARLWLRAARSLFRRRSALDICSCETAISETAQSWIGGRAGQSFAVDQGRRLRLRSAFLYIGLQRLRALRSYIRALNGVAQRDGGLPDDRCVCCPTAVVYAQPVALARAVDVRRCSYV